ncbi:MAG: RelA/SpoT domain-containing protein [Lachnospiraceae bacterium]|nr:RelA/SpoT domain-containing protein [Lachnospiraceae bacterium]
MERVERDYPQIWSRLCRIYDDFEYIANNTEDDKRKKLTEYQSLVLKEFDNISFVYRVCSRIKEPDSLIVKIVNKIYEGKEIYTTIDETNYYQIVTDLIGIRIIHKFVGEWEQINELIYEKFYKGDEYFIEDYNREYSCNRKLSFLIECPEIHYPLNGRLDLYQETEKRLNIKFKYTPNNRNYRGVHYLVNYYGIYVEIQVRTLSDELWGEVNHDFVYKMKRTEKKDKLTAASDLLRTILLAGDAVCMYMKEHNDDNKDKAEEYLTETRDIIKKADQMLLGMDVCKGDDDYGISGK